MAVKNALVMERLKSVILNDASTSMDTLLKVLRSDLHCLLSEYMILQPESLKINFEIDEEGMINLFVDAKTSHIIDIGYTLPD